MFKQKRPPEGWEKYMPKIGFFSRYTVRDWPMLHERACRLWESELERNRIESFKKKRDGILSKIRGLTHEGIIGMGALEFEKIIGEAYTENIFRPVGLAEDVFDRKCCGYKRDHYGIVYEREQREKGPIVFSTREFFDFIVGPFGSREEYFKFMIKGDFSEIMCFLAYEAIGAEETFKQLVKAFGSQERYFRFMIKKGPLECMLTVARGVIGRKETYKQLVKAFDSEKRSANELCSQDEFFCLFFKKDFQRLMDEFIRGPNALTAPFDRLLAAFVSEEQLVKALCSKEEFYRSVFSKEFESSMDEFIPGAVAGDVSFKQLVILWGLQEKYFSFMVRPELTEGFLFSSTDYGEIKKNFKRRKIEITEEWEDAAYNVWTHRDSAGDFYRTVLESGRLNTYGEDKWRIDAFEKMFDLACKALGKVEVFNRTLKVLGSLEEYFRRMARTDGIGRRGHPLFDVACEALGKVETFKQTMNAYREMYGNQYLEVYQKVRKEPHPTMILFNDGAASYEKAKVFEDYRLAAHQDALLSTLSWFYSYNSDEDDILSIARTAGLVVSKEFWSEFCYMYLRSLPPSGGSSSSSGSSGAGDHGISCGGGGGGSGGG